MKRVKYKFHPETYELGENEKFYSDMEASGWRLVKRGAYLSKFVPAEPSRARYRVEVSAPGFLEEANMSEAQLAVFADCGWEHVTDQGLLYIFRAPEGSDAPEFYGDPRQQAATLRNMRTGLWAWLPVAALIWAPLMLMSLSMKGGPSQVWADVQKSWVVNTAGVLWFGVFLVWALYHFLREAWSVTRTYRRLRKGIPLDHAPKKRRLVHRAVNGTLIAAEILCLLLMGVQILELRPRELPEEPDGPYIVLADLGKTGPRTVSFTDQESELSHGRSLMAEYWETAEYKEDSTLLRQDVYRLGSAEKAMEFARTLMVDSTFGQSEEAFELIEIPGLDGAWAADRLEVVAVKGRYAAYITYIGGNEWDPMGILNAVAERWG